MLAGVKNKVSRTVRREDGSSIVELAVVFPILLLLFVGIAELGRLFYTYTTLAKATKTGARYLSTSRNVVKGTVDQKAAAREEARSLVVCGFLDCTDKKSIATGLTTAEVSICDNFSVPCNPVIPAGPIKYFKVEITNYPYTPGVFNLGAMTGGGSSSIYFPLTPGTEMRYMPN
jgi:hypothetical protein